MALWIDVDFGWPKPPSVQPAPPVKKVFFPPETEPADKYRPAYGRYRNVTSVSPFGPQPKTGPILPQSSSDWIAAAQSRIPANLLDLGPQIEGGGIKKVGQDLLGAGRSFQQNVVEPLAGSVVTGAEMLLTPFSTGEWERKTSDLQKQGLNRWQAAGEAWRGTDLPSAKIPIDLPVVGRPSVGLKGTLELGLDPLNWAPGVGLVGYTSKGAKAVGATAKKAAPAIGEAIQDIAAQGKPTLRPRMGVTPGELPKEPIKPLPLEDFNKAPVISKKLNKALASPEPTIRSGLMSDLQGVDELVNIASRENLGRKLGNLPGVKQVSSIFNPSAIAKTVAEKARVARAALLEQGTVKTTGAFSTLEELGGAAKIFGKLADGEVLTTGPLKGIPLSDVLTYRNKYAAKLTPAQREYAERFHALSDGIKQLMNRNGLKIKELAFDEGGEWVGRRMVGKLTADGQTVETAFVGPAARGGKAGFEKERYFKTMADAITDGYKPLSVEETLKLNIQGAYRRVADEKIKNWVLSNVPFRESAGKAAGVGEATVRSPAFKEKVLIGKEARSTADSLNKMFDAQYSDLDRMIRAGNQWNAVARTFSFAGDVSIFLIQLITMPLRHPVVTAKTVRNFAKAMFNKTSNAAYLAKNNDVIQKSTKLITSHGGTTEMTEAFNAGGIMSSKYAKYPRKLLEPFQRGYEAAMDTAGIETLKSMEHRIVTAADRADIEQAINIMRGLTSSSAIGVSPSVRALESLVTLAPRYNRAIASWTADVLQGGIRGEEARKSLASLIAGAVGMTTAISLARGEGWGGVAEHLDLRNPTKFMTWDVAGQNVGPGSAIRSLAILLAKISDTPDQLVDHVTKFVKSKQSPLVSTVSDIASGKDFNWQPTRPGKGVGVGEGMLRLTKRVVADNLTPIWIMGAAEGGGGLEGMGVRGAVEFFGGRGYPAPQEPSPKYIPVKLESTSGGKRFFPQSGPSEVLPKKSKFFAD